MLISSIANPRVKTAARLRERRGREAQGRIIIDGVREISRAIAAEIEISELFYFPQLCQDAEHKAILDRLGRGTAGQGRAGQGTAELIEVTPPVMEKLAYGNRVEGLVAVAPTPRRTLADLQLSADSLVAVVEGVEKPGNLGAILRTADAAGVAAVIVAGGITDLYNPNAIRASLGAIFTVPLAAAASQAALDWLRQRSYRLIAARVDGAVEYTAADLRGGAAIILGSEAAGLSSTWREGDIVAVKLPMLGQVDSLNLSATAAVLFYEALRQRRPSSSA